MKVRTGFVSNSSSASFIIATKCHNATEEERKVDYEAVMKRYIDLIQEDPCYQKQIEPVVKKIQKHYDAGEYVTEIVTSQYYDADVVEKMFDQLYNFGVKIIHKEFE